MAVRNRVGDILLKAGVLDELELRAALTQQAQWGGSLARIVVEREMATEEAVTRALAAGLQVDWANLGALAQPDRAALAKVDADYAEKHHVFPVAIREGGRVLVLALEDPTNLAVIDALALRTRLRVLPTIAGEQELRRAIRRHYHGEVEPEPPPAAAAADDALEEEPLVLPDPGNSSLLDALAAVEARSAELTPEEQQRLAALRENQAKSSRILRALVEVLVDRGHLSPEELRQRRGRAAR